MVKELELVQVVYKNDFSVTLGFLDNDDNGSIIVENNLTLLKYDKEKKSFIKCPKKEKFIRELVNDVFECDFNQIETRLNNYYKVHVKDMYVKLINDVLPFTIEDVGKNKKGKVLKAIDTGLAVEFTTLYNGGKYMVKSNYYDYVESIGKSVANANKRKVLYNKLKSILSEDISRFEGRILKFNVETFNNGFKDIVYTSIQGVVENTSEEQIDMSICVQDETNKEIKTVQDDNIVVNDFSKLI